MSQKGMYLRTIEIRQKQRISMLKNGGRPPTQLGVKQSKETIERRRLKLLGKKRTKEYSIRFSALRKGIIYNYAPGIKEKLAQLASERFKGKRLTEKHRENIKLGLLGHSVSQDTKEKISRSHLGKPNHKIRGKNHYNWKNGKTDFNSQIRQSLEYRNWRRQVFERDNFICQECKIRGGYLEADHIKPFAYYPELIYQLSNGRTLCRSCHRKTNTYGVKNINKSYVTSKFNS